MGEADYKQRNKYVILCPGKVGRKELGLWRVFKGTLLRRFEKSERFEEKSARDGEQGCPCGEEETSGTASVASVHLDGGGVSVPLLTPSGFDCQF